MSDRSSGVEWVETTEEVVIAEECLSPGDNGSAVIPVLEPAKTPIQRLLDTVGHGDNPDSEDGFYCEECLTLFQDQSDPTNISGPSFILDFPTSVGVPQRALLSLPHGLMIGRSSIPSAGIGVINHGPVVSPGMHFGPYEGEVTTREDAMESHFSWEIYKGKDEYEYIDAARESNSNWMRYINCARSKDETNLLAVQYKGSILFHCCRTINPGDELMVWPSSKLLSRFSEPWGQVWLMKVNATENNTTATGQIFLCSQCQLTFTTEAFLQSHVQHFHTQPEEGDAAEADDPGNPAVGADSDGPVSSLLLVPGDGDRSNNTCGDCGKIFKQIPHLRRHRLCVHSNKRPYCCPQCRRTFSQASGLIRHQLVHKKPADAGVDPDQDPPPLGEEKEGDSQRPELVEPAEAAVIESVDVSETLSEDVDEAEETSAAEAEPSLSICSDCGKSFTNDASLKKHRVTVHERLRPYVCTVCQKCFGQYSDLTRHLRRHQKQSKCVEMGGEAAEESGSLPFSCGQCALEFPSVDSLQQHIDECHKEQNQEEDLVSAGEDQEQDPDFIPQVSEAESAQKRPSLRPQRPGSLSKISALTRLIAPKRKAAAVDEPATGASQAEGSDTDPEEASDGTNSKLVKYKWFSCNHCKQMYGDPEELRTHKCALRQHKCGQCGATFSKSGFLKRHEQMAHGEPKDYSCERCGKVFSTSGNMRQHERSNTCLKYHCNSELFSCSYCQFSFTMRSYLIKHIKRHHPDEYLSQCDPESAGPEAPEEEAAAAAADREYVCPQCGKTCPSSRALKLHTCFQQVNVLYLCTDCGKGFTNHYSLKQHQRVHTGEKPYSCPHCGKSFSYTGQLNVHLRTHTGEKPYLCTHCGESFRQSGDLKRHERKHTGVRPYSCPECCKSFSRPQSLKAHQMLHQGEKMFKCTQCGKSFSRNYHLRRHHQKMHM